jgi:hypothetical protein
MCWKSARNRGAGAYLQPAGIADKIDLAAKYTHTSDDVFVEDVAPQPFGDGENTLPDISRYMTNVPRDCCVANDAPLQRAPLLQSAGRRLSSSIVRPDPLHAREVPHGVAPACQG